MAGAAAVVVEVDAASGRLAAEFQHHFAAVTQAVAIVLDRLARAESEAETAAVSLEAAGNWTSLRDVIEAA